MDPLIDRVRASSLQQAVKGNLPTGHSIGDLENGSGSLAHVGLFVMLANFL